MFKWFLPTAVAMLFGILVLLGTVLPSTILQQLRVLLIEWAVVLSAFALLLAYINILRVHTGRLGRLVNAKKGNPASFISSLLVVISALGTLVLVIWSGPDHPLTQILVRDVLVPGESALLALTAITLILAGMRALQNRRSFGSVVFVLVAGFILLSTIPYIDVFRPIVQFVDLMSTAGMRGLLMGAALGTTLTGLRVILGIDRPHSDE